MECFFDLAVSTDGYGRPAGFVGTITANSFMKREFGRKLIEQCIPNWDLTHVIDTSGAYIPGHTTPTVILFGRHQGPVQPVIRTVMGVRGEPSPPTDAAKGLVWSAIVAQIDQPGSESEYISVADTDRVRFVTHPWSIGGGGAAELMEQFRGGSVLRSMVEAIGISAIAGEDEVFIADSPRYFKQAGVEAVAHRPLVIGDRLRDWRESQLPEAVFPYSATELLAVEQIPGFARWTWPYRPLSEIE